MNRNGEMRDASGPRIIAANGQEFLAFENAPCRPRTQLETGVFPLTLSQCGGKIRERARVHARHAPHGEAAGDEGFPVFRELIEIEEKSGADGGAAKLRQL